MTTHTESTEITHRFKLDGDDVFAHAQGKVNVRVESIELKQSLRSGYNVAYLRGPRILKSGRLGERTSIGLGDLTRCPELLALMRRFDIPYGPRLTRDLLAVRVKNGGCDVDIAPRA